MQDENKTFEVASKLNEYEDIVYFLVKQIKFEILTLIFPELNHQ